MRLPEVLQGPGEHLRPRRVLQQNRDQAEQATYALAHQPGSATREPSASASSRARVAAIHGSMVSAVHSGPEESSSSGIGMPWLDRRRHTVTSCRSMPRASAISAIP